jgi:hypothetical protein
MARLTSEQVRTIRVEWEPGATEQLGARYGLSISTVVKRVTWEHVAGQALARPTALQITTRYSQGVRRAQRHSCESGFSYAAPVRELPSGATPIPSGATAVGLAPACSGRKTENTVPVRDPPARERTRIDPL